MLKLLQSGHSQAAFYAGFFVLSQATPHISENIFAFLQ